MTQHNLLSFTRLNWLILNDLKLQAKTILIVAATLIVLFALMPFHITSGSTAYFFILYVGGIFISGSAFADYHDARKAFFSLTLPCSNFERFLSRWIETTILYAIGLLLFYYLFSLLSYTVNLYGYHQQVQLFDVMQPSLWQGILEYFIFQSIILLGAVTFKKNALIKTFLAVGCYFLALSILSGLTTWIFCPQCLQHGITFHVSIHGNHFIFWLIAAVVFWTVTYLRLSEIELR